jgi:small subunit ribosomal protein S9
MTKVQEIEDQTTQLPEEEVKERQKEDQKFLDLANKKIGQGKYIEKIGRRKEAVARVRIWDNEVDKEFSILINDLDYKNYFQNLEFRKIVESPLKKVNLSKKFKITVKVKGGGKRGQAEAIRLGLSRALVAFDETLKPRLKKAGFLTRDPRVVERKKYGKRKARKEEQWQKR